MPGWYSQLKPYIDDGSLVMLGVIQEQHADRCRLFKQWKKLDFPVVQDLLNTNGIDVVPVYVAIDEAGVVRGRPRDPKKLVQDFIKATFADANETELKKGVIPLSEGDSEAWNKRLDESRSIDHLIGTADAMMLWSTSESKVGQAIAVYEEALKKSTELGGDGKDRSDIWFRMGAAYRLHYEKGEQANPDRFQKSVNAWETALRLNPNQYIYRRRIEQYGPRLKKPYSFYDWVTQAREEIESRGETPIELTVEPNGAELAKRAKEMQVDTAVVNPDPDDAVVLVEEPWVTVHANVVPTKPRPGEVVAVHLGFHVSKDAKWNHEAAPLQVWINSPKDGIEISTQGIEDQTPYRVGESRQPISISFEAKLPKDHKGPIEFSGFALFNICESGNGQCVFRRRNFTVRIE